MLPGEKAFRVVDPETVPDTPPAADGPASVLRLGLDAALVRDRVGVGRGRRRDARARGGGCRDAGRQWDARAARRRLTGPPHERIDLWLPPSTTVTDQDIAVLAEQLGRPPRGVVGIAARCVCGRPLVVRTAPRLDDGTPFPTTYYLTCPPAVAAVSTLEAGGLMKEMTARLADDEELAAAYRRAHEDYLVDREALGHVEEIAGISAGGMPTRVKCLHVLVGARARGRPRRQPDRRRGPRA